MTTEIVQNIPTELERAEALRGIAPDGAATIAAGYAPHFIAFRELATQARDISPDAPKAARTMRLQLKAVRVEAEKTRKALKEDSLRRGKAIDGVYNLLEYSLKPVEDAMEEIEKAEERREAARKAALAEARRAELSPFADPQHYNLGEMPEDQWKQLLAGAQAAKAAAEEAARKAEEERIAVEKVEAARRAKAEEEARLERERLAAENARLAAEKAESDRKAAEAAEAQRMEREAAAKREAELKAEADRVAREAAEKARIEREAAAKRERELQAERDRLAREAEEAQRKERERIAAEDAAKKAAAAAPDKEKLAAFAQTIRRLPVPELTSESGREFETQLHGQMTKFAAWVESKAAAL